MFSVIFEFLFISIFSCWFSSFLLLVFFSIVVVVFNSNCSFCLYFVCICEKVKPSFVCWSIAQTMTHATCEWGQL
jgi:hypothetical protein